MQQTPVLHTRIPTQFTSLKAVLQLFVFCTLRGLVWAELPIWNHMNSAPSEKPSKCVLLFCSPSSDCSFCHSPTPGCSRLVNQTRGRRAELEKISSKEMSKDKVQTSFLSNPTCLFLVTRTDIYNVHNLHVSSVISSQLNSERNDV